MRKITGYFKINVYGYKFGRERISLGLLSYFVGRGFWRGIMLGLAFYVWPGHYVALFFFYILLKQAPPVCPIMQPDFLPKFSFLCSKISDNGWRQQWSEWRVKGLCYWSGHLWYGF